MRQQSHEKQAIRILSEACMLVTFVSRVHVIGISVCKVNNMYDILCYVLGMCMLYTGALV